METKRYKKNIKEWREEISHEIEENATASTNKQSATPADLFKKRRYQSMGEFFAHCGYLAVRVRHIPIVWDMLKAVSRASVTIKEVEHHKSSKTVSPQFRERLMLAVTSVNACNACSYAHARAALTEGISEDEVDMLLSGHFENCPKEEQAALLYAQHWAEHEGKPEKDARDKAMEIYGKNKLQAIEFTMGSIRIGNYLGNTWEYFEFKQQLKKQRKRQLGENA